MKNTLKTICCRNTKHLHLQQQNETNMKGKTIEIWTSAESSGREKPSLCKRGNHQADSSTMYAPIQRWISHLKDIRKK